MSESNKIDEAKLKALNISQQTLLEIEKKCKVKLRKRSGEDISFDSHELMNLDVQYYEDFIGELSDKFNEFVLKSERWKEKAIKLQ